MNRLRKILLSTAMGLVLSSSVMAQTHMDGWDAFNREDYATAYRIWKTLAEKKDAHAQNNLGLMYQLGRGVVQDHKEAAKWFRLAANQGHSSGQRNIGLMYKRGHGVVQDYKEAVKWFRLSANQGNANAQDNLGGMYENGHGVVQNNVRAHKWYNISSSNGATWAGESRDDIAKRMTQADISRAQEMARRCVASGYKECD